MTAVEAKALTDFVGGCGEKANIIFRELVEALPVAVYTTDAQGRLTYFNAAARKLSGRVPMLGTDQWCVTWKIFHPDGTPVPHDQCPMALALKGAEVPTGIECIAERPDGTRFWFIPYPAVLRDTEGRITGGINVLVDITGRKNREIEANEQFRAIVETTPECVKIVAPDGTLQFMNASGLAMVEANSADRVTGMNVYDLVAPEDRNSFRQFNERICRGEKGALEFDMIGLRGARSHMETHAAPLRHSDGTTVQLAITRDITGRKKAERVAPLLDAIVDSSYDAIISKDLNGVITSWNKSAERLFGYTAAETIGQPVTILIPTDRLKEEPKILEQLKRGECVDHFETIRRKKDGTLMDISLTISPVKDLHGNIIGASKIARDITDRKRAEKEIESLNAHLAADLVAMTRMQQISTHLMRVDDLRQLLDEITEAGIEITGADQGNIQLLEDGNMKVASQRGFAAPFLDFFNDVCQRDAAFRTAMNCGERVIIEDVAQSPIFAGTPALEVMLAAGVRAVQSTPLVSRSGQVLGMFSTHYRSPGRLGDRELRLLDILARQAADLIERRLAETELLASEARFRQLADAMPQMVWTARPDGHIDYYNERWYQFAGFARDTFGDQSWEPHLHPDDVQRCRDGWDDAVNSGAPYNVECRFWDRSENRWRWFVVRALRVRDESGKNVKWVGTCTDIDAQKKIEDALRRANGDLEQFAFSASHDLQEPLRTVQIYSELLTKECGDAIRGAGEEYLTYLRSGATRAGMLVRDLLSYTQAANFQSPTEPADAGEALAATLENLAGIIAETGAQITSDRLPALRVHATHLKQLFQNLIGNAIKYRSSDRPPTVHVRARRQNRDWVFSVSDNGIGIDPKYKENIFGLFKRLHTSDEYSGTGIGLAICRRIVDRYCGRIWVESEPGKGSTFVFTLPA